MRNRLIIDGNAVYEIDDECMKKKQIRNSLKGSDTQGSYTRPDEEERKRR